MKYLLAIITLFTTLHCYADQFNPCEYMNMNSNVMNKLDVGDDENFRRIVQQKNQEMVRACLDYETKLMQTQHDDLNRDNY